MNKRKLFKVAVLSAVLILVLTIVSIGSSNSKVGSTEDPLVSLSYVEMRFEAFNEHVASQLKEITDALAKVQTNEPVKDAGTEPEQETDTTKEVGGTTVASDLYTKYRVVEVPAGKKITFGESTEIILRGGSARAVVSDQGGLSDLTDGVDIQGDANMPLNHLILIPRNDGRGFVTDKKVWVMVKGDYNIADQ